MTAAVMMPIAGRVMDVVGARLVALWAIALFGFTVISLYFVPGNLWLFYAWFFVIGITAGGAAPGPFARVISAWFDKRRGLALGLSMAGVGLGATIMPLLARTSIAAFGWRGAYVVIGCVILSVLPVLLWLLHNEPSHEKWVVTSITIPEPSPQPLRIGLSGYLPARLLNSRPSGCF